MSTGIDASKDDIVTCAKLVNANVDIAKPIIVEVEKRGKRLWVNVNGICVLRICQADRITMKTISC